MKTIQYEQTALITADPIADALLDYAEALAEQSRSAVVEIPIVADGDVAVARLLIGVGIPVVSVPRTRVEWSEEQAATRVRDEFGSPGLDVDPSGVVIDDLVVHRAVHALVARVTALRDAPAASSVDGHGPDRQNDAVPSAEAEAENQLTRNGTVTSITDSPASAGDRSERADRWDDRR